MSALVNVCPDLDKEAKQKIIGSISGDAPQREAEPTGLIRAVSCLDAKDQDLFEPLVKACVKELEIRHGEEVQSSKEKFAAEQKNFAAKDKEIAQDESQDHDDGEHTAEKRKGACRNGEAGRRA